MTYQDHTEEIPVVGGRVGWRLMAKGWAEPEKCISHSGQILRYDLGEFIFWKTVDFKAVFRYLPRCDHSIFAI